MSKLLDRFRYFKQKGESFANGHGQVYNTNRDWEDSYRQRWQFDKIVRSTHGVNCTGSCSWKIYVKNGLVTPRLFVFDTENAVITITGSTNMATERLDLTIDPESKGLRVLTLRSPLYVRGTYKNPDAGVKPGPLIARGAAAVALGAVVAPAAALLALISPSDSAENQCDPILQQMKEK